MGQNTWGFTSKSVALGSLLSPNFNTFMDILYKPDIVGGKFHLKKCYFHGAMLLHTAKIEQ